jgi:hypothetical protein
MKIASTDIQLASQHTAITRDTVRESLRMWVAPPPEAGRPGSGNRLPESAPTVSISAEARSALETAPTTEIDPDKALELDLRYLLIKRMVEQITGHEIKHLRASDLQAAPPADLPDPVTAAAPAPARQPAGFGIEYDRHESHYEAEQTLFAAQGVVKTADGREIRFQLELAMSREYHREETISVRAGDAVVKDPLVINFGGQAAQLGGTRFSFDLDADGMQDTIAFVGSGSGFLVLDRNRDGIVNDGSELFGPRTGNGFQELARYDVDGNHWIDESDPVFSELHIWTRDAERQDRLTPLAEMSIGAIGLAQTATPFSLKTNENELLGQVRSSGVYLNENGTAGSVQQIDLVV